MKKIFLTLAFLSLIAGVFQPLSNADQADTEEIIKLKEQIRKNPNDSQAHRLLGLAYGKLGKNQEATDELKEAIRLLQPNNKGNKITPPEKIDPTQDVVADSNNAVSNPKSAEPKLSSSDTEDSSKIDSQNKPITSTSRNIIKNTVDNRPQAGENSKPPLTMKDFIKDLTDNPLLLVFIGVMVLVGTYIHVFAFTTQAVAHGPSFFTTLGILATFLGIALGLFHFDVDDVQESIPNLLEGIKMAFWASVVGVFFAITLKARFAIFGVPSKHQKGEIYGATIDDLVGQMKGVQQAIVGNDDSTLLSQMKLTRQDVNDRLDALKRSQEAFMERMADNNSKALIEALKEVIRDFNAKINEQFGENFKQLNLAVGKILEWQENYRLQMAEMIEQQTKTASNMATATASYEEILDSTKNFWIVAEKLAPIIEALNNQRNQIEQSLTSLGQLLTTASGSLPAVEKKIIELTEQMTRGVRTANEDSTKAIRETTEAILNTVTEMRKMMVDVVQKTNQEFNMHISGITTKTQEQVNNLNIALDTELNNSLKTLGQQLATLSQKFVEDYTPLTERLRDVLKISKGTL